MSLQFLKQIHSHTGQQPLTNNNSVGIENNEDENSFFEEVADIVTVDKEHEREQDSKKLSSSLGKGKSSGRLSQSKRTNSAPNSFQLFLSRRNQQNGDDKAEEETSDGNNSYQINKKFVSLPSLFDTQKKTSNMKLLHMSKSNLKKVPHQIVQQNSLPAIPKVNAQVSSPLTKSSSTKEINTTVEASSFLQRTESYMERKDDNNGREMSESLQFGQQVTEDSPISVNSFGEINNSLAQQAEDEALIKRCLEILECSTTLEGYNKMLSLWARVKQCTKQKLNEFLDSNAPKEMKYKLLATSKSKLKELREVYDAQSLFFEWFGKIKKIYPMEQKYFKLYAEKIFELAQKKASSPDQQIVLLACVRLVLKEMKILLRAEENKKFKWINTKPKARAFPQELI